MDFDNWITRREKVSEFVSEAGTPFVDQYAYNEDAVLVKTGRQTNLQDRIQSYEEECNINNIVKKFIDGDLEAFNRKHGFYADLSEMPTSLAEYHRLFKDTEEAFDMLPDEFKANFEDAADLISSIGTDRYEMAFRAINKTDIDDKKEEVKEDAE